MGAIGFYREATGENAQDAYDNAVSEATQEVGHQDGYSGDLNSKDGFVLSSVPSGVEFKDWINALNDGTLPDTLMEHQEAFKKQYAIYNDKWGPALCFEVPDEKAGGFNLYAFLGFAPW